MAGEKPKYDTCYCLCVYVAARNKDDLIVFVGGVPPRMANRKSSHSESNPRLIGEFEARIAFEDFDILWKGRLMELSWL